MQSKSALLVTTTLLILFNGPIFGANLEREKRMALEIVDSISMGVTIIPRSVVLLLRWQQIQQAGNPLSRQSVVDDADHYFTDRGDDLVEPVGKWLDSPGIE